MHLAIFVSSLHTGGTQRQATLLANALANDKVTVNMVTIFPDGQFWRYMPGPGNVQFFSLFDRRPKSRLKRILAYFLAPLRLRRFLKKNRPEVVYSMLDVSNLISRLATLGLGKELLLVWGLRASKWIADYRAVIPFLLCKMLSPSVPLVISNSAFGLANYEKHGFRCQKSAVILNGLDAAQFRFDADGRGRLRSEWQVSDDQLLVGLVGRLTPMKGQDTFVEVASVLQKRLSKLRFVCVGSGSTEYRSTLQALVDKHGLSNIFQFADHLDDIAAAYSAMDVVVSCSLAEGFSNAVGEAMACSRACVVTDVGDSATLLGDCGLVVAASDVGAMANAVMSALKNRAPMGICGRKRVEDNFSVAAMVESTRRVLDNAIADYKLPSRYA